MDAEESGGNPSFAFLPPSEELAIASLQPTGLCWKFGMVNRPYWVVGQPHKLAPKLVVFFPPFGTKLFE
jgi:hypothetical protein